MKSRGTYTCPCCGFLSFSESPGNYEVCHICFWEDDPVQLLDPWFKGGANRVSLEEAQANFAEIRVSEARFKSDVQGILVTDVRDPFWRPVDETDRPNVRTPAQLEIQNPKGPWPWYYWKL